MSVTTAAVEPADTLFDLLNGIGGTDLTVASGDTYTVSAGDTEAHGTVNVGGTLNVAGTLNVSTLSWTLDEPTVLHWESRAESERGPGHDQPAEVYTWQPTRTPRDRFSADTVLAVERPTVEAWVYTLDRDDVATYARDIIDFVEEYLDDQYQRTPYGSLTPTGVEDFREAKVARRSAHYVYAVEVEFERLDATGP